ncbi:hypothetical protein BWI17_16110 [Betaproteobacteria bacterium GR16-43]|nr:hypothetical protein BWI17_16110 [Betaproteobacteria bacterium GR16-43]
MRGALLAAFLLGSLPAAAHTSDCGGKSGIDKARCERHETMYKKCVTVKGEEHFACDRTYLLANPLPCKEFPGNDAARCTKENEAFAACESNAGRAFMKCVRSTTGESPMGH